MIPNVNITILDGALGILPASAGDVCAVIGCSTIGALNTPTPFFTTKDLVAGFGRGDAVEAAANIIEKTGKPIVFVRMTEDEPGQIVPGAQVGSGTSVISGSGAPVDTYQVYVIVTAGGTIGVTGIKFRWSLDGGRNLSPVVALDTANSYDITEAGVTIDFAAGTLVAGDVAYFDTIAPKWNALGIDDAITSLAQTSLRWNFIQLVGPATVAEADVLGELLTEFESDLQRTLYKFAFVDARDRDGYTGNYTETFPQYVANLSDEWVDFANPRIVAGAGRAFTRSSISRREYRRSPCFAAVARAVDVAISIDLAQVDLGQLPGVRIKDLNGNPAELDETVYPGLDDARFLTLRSLDGFPGVYVNNPRIMSAPGSDFDLIQQRRVMDKACETVKFTLTRRLSSRVQVDRVTGFILKQDKLEIESAVNSALRAALLTPGHASDAIFTLAPNDNILSTRTLTGEARIIPLGYIKTINVTIGFANPVIQAV